jgi:hypothetical protein
MAPWQGGQASGNSPDVEGLIRQVMVTAARHVPYERQLEIP